MKKCASCDYSGIEPQDMDLTCHHPKAGTHGQHVLRGPIKECGPQFIFWKQHPGRTPEGYLKL